MTVAPDGNSGCGAREQAGAVGAEVAEERRAEEVEDQAVRRARRRVVATSMSTVGAPALAVVVTTSGEAGGVARIERRGVEQAVEHGDDGRDVGERLAVPGAHRAVGPCVGDAGAPVVRGRVAGTTRPAGIASRAAVGAGRLPIGRHASPLTIPVTQSGVSGVTVVAVGPAWTIVNSISSGAPGLTSWLGVHAAPRPCEGTDQDAERFPRGWRKRPFHTRLL